MPASGWLPSPRWWRDGWSRCGQVRPPPNLLDLLPPNADVYALIELEALQSNPFLRRLLADSANVTGETDYQELLRQTGFHYQEDLKQLAMARIGEDWVGVAEVNVDQARMVSYLESHGAARLNQGDKVIYAFGAAHPLRMAFLDGESVAFAVGADPILLQGILDRVRRQASDSAAADLQRNGVQLAKSGIALFARVDRLLDANPQGLRIGPFQLGKEWLQGSQTLVATVNSGPVTLNAQIDDRCKDAASAQRISGGFKAMLAILNAVPSSQGSSGGSDVTFKTLLSGVTITQADRSVLMDWHATPSMLVALLGDSK